MGVFQDLTGKKFNRLTALERSYTKGSKLYWKCVCECGKIVIVRGNGLVTGNNKSCGCIMDDYHSGKLKRKPMKRQPFGVTAFNCLYCVYRHGAKTRDLEFKLDKDVFKKLTSSNCFNCGRTPSNIFREERSIGYYKYNGVDRKNSNKGYTVSNCVPCCFKCNFGKKDYTQKEFDKWILESSTHKIISKQVEPSKELVEFIKNNY
jgi:hypothetical protein